MNADVPCLLRIIHNLTTCLVSALSNTKLTAKLPELKRPCKRKCLFSNLSSYQLPGEVSFLNDKETRSFFCPDYQCVPWMCLFSNFFGICLGNGDVEEVVGCSLIQLIVIKSLSYHSWYIALLVKTFIKGKSRVATTVFSNLFILYLA